LNAATPGTTNLALTDSLPLTCSLNGICCHGKIVGMNPWELARLATEKGLTSRVFRDRYCELGGIRLRFDMTTGWNGLTECSLWVSAHGCSAYLSRPLVCRLYPIGRLQQGKKLHYVHLGSSFPCLESCPDVLDLPFHTVAEYLAEQHVSASESAQEKYQELMQRLADNAFVLLLETGLAASGDHLTLRLWRKLGQDTPEHLAQFLGPEWIDRLMLPDISGCLTDPVAFACQHHEMLQSQAQALFGNLGDFAALHEASGLMMGLALHLGRGLGINPAELADHWIVVAKQLGARE
jgi:Fe-S-cluster containining protein